MMIVNFSHPLTEEQIEKIEKITNCKVNNIIDVKTMFDNNRSFAEQVQELLDSVTLTPTQWQTEQIVIVPPALSYITAVLLAELHGRMGYFPTIIRLRPVEGAVPPRFEVAEIINLQEVRENARRKR